MSYHIYSRIRGDVWVVPYTIAAYSSALHEQISFLFLCTENHDLYTKTNKQTNKTKTKQNKKTKTKTKKTYRLNMDQ